MHIILKCLCWDTHLDEVMQKLNSTSSLIFFKNFSFLGGGGDETLEKYNLSIVNFSYVEHSFSNILIAALTLTYYRSFS